MTHTRDSLIVALHRWVQERGELPRAVDWVRASYTHPSQSSVRYVFGSWNAFVRAAGYQPRPNHCPGHTGWTEETVIAACLLFFERHGRTPRTREWLSPHPDYPHRDQAYRFFGTWNAMIRAAGFEPRSTHPPRVWTPARVTDAFCDFVVREGRWPVIRDCESPVAEGMPHRGTVIGLFGSWSAAKLAAGWIGARCSGCSCSQRRYTPGCRQCRARRYWRYRRKSLTTAPAGSPIASLAPVDDGATAGAYTHRDAVAA